MSREKSGRKITKDYQTTMGERGHVPYLLNPLTAGKEEKYCVRQKYIQLTHGKNAW